MPVENQIKNQHLLWRAAFGPSSNDTLHNGSLTPFELYDVLEKQSTGKPVYIDVADNTVKGLLMGIKSEVPMNENENPGVKKSLTDKQKKDLRRQSVEDIENLNMAWLDEMINGNAQLREKVALFWHGHFACRVINIYYQQLMLHEIRSNALGNFGDLLRAVSKSAAMLSFLNNQQNRKQHPNENFAREVMELFTLGRGNYAEKDIKEAARAFTGWGFTLNGDFVFRQFFHDSDIKNILGKTGNFDGDDVLDILLEQKQTAFFIAKKMYKYFVNENTDNENIRWLAERFYNSNYEIKTLLKDIFTSNWFYDAENIGAKIKSPVELFVGIRRILPMNVENEKILLLYQKALGQVLFYPPNVAGWPGGKNWIDSSSLMMRLRLPQLIKDDDSFYVTPKEDDDQQMGMIQNFSSANTGNGKNGFQIKANVDWEKFTGQFEKIAKENLYTEIEQMLLQTKANTVDKTVILENVNTVSREAYIQSLAVALMSTPEYQLC